MIRAKALLLRPNSCRGNASNQSTAKVFTSSVTTTARGQDLQAGRRPNRSLIKIVPPLAPKIKAQPSQGPTADERIPFCASSFYGGFFPRKQDIYFEDLSPLPDPEDEDFHYQFLYKCKVCCKLCDFRNPEADLMAKANKEKALNDIFSRLKTMEGVGLTPDETAAVVNMITANIVREFSIATQRQLFLDDLSNIPELAWPHLSIVYQILNVVFRLAGLSNHFGANFLDSMLKVFDTPCELEQQQLLSFMKMYLRAVPSLKEPIMRRFNSMLDRSVGLGDFPFFLKPVLKIIERIVTTADDHLPIFDTLFRCHLVRLLSNRYLHRFHEPLLNIYDYFIDHKRSNASRILKYLLNHWPIVINEKQVIYLQFMTAILPKVNSKDMSANLNRVFAIYAEATVSQSSVVAEAATMVWTNLQSERLIIQYAKQVLPIMVPALSAAVRDHWALTVRQASMESLELLAKVDQKFIESLRQRERDRKRDVNINQNPQLKTWANIARMACKRDKSINLAKALQMITKFCNDYRSAADSDE